MTQTEAVLRSLCELNKPVTYKEVHEYIIQNGYFPFDGDTPAQSVSTRLIELLEDGIVQRRKEGTFLYYLFQEENTMYVADSIEFEEGQISYRLHLSRERNQQVIRQAKENFKQKHGKLFCLACDFDFEEKYGMLGKDFIEGHHTLPLSKMFERHKTKPEDIAMLCANCHRMIHKELMTVDELRKLVKK